LTNQRQGPRWLRENEDKIEVFHPPGCSPELTPGEPLNANLKHRATAAAPPKTKVRLVKTACRVPRSFRNQPTCVERRFQHQDASYGA
jgi:hypothetical protein